MFLININKEIVSSWKKDVSADLDASSFYKALKENHYDIYFSYDSASQLLLYEALPKDDKDSYHSLIVLINRTIRSIGKTIATGYSKAFALYLHEKEAKMDEEALKEVYGMYYSQLLPLASMSYEDALDRQEMLPLFRQFAKELLLNDSSEKAFITDQKLKIEYVIHPYGQGFEIKIRIGFDKTKMLKSSLDFLAKSKTGGAVEFYRDFYTISPTMISDEDKAVLGTLNSENISSDSHYSAANTSSIYVSEEGLCALLFALAGRPVYFDALEYRVDPEVIVPKVFINEDGSFTFDPKINGRMYFNSMNGAMINDRLRLVSLLTFASKKEVTVFKFVKDNPTFRFDLFQNEISSDIVPVLEGKVEVSSQFKERHPSSKEEIRYYVTYTEDDRLQFRTEFMHGEEQVSETVFAMTPLGENRLHQFRSALDYFNLPMEGKISDQGEILSFLRQDLMPLRRCCSVFLSENLANKKISGVGKLNISMKSGIDWLEMELGSDFYTSDELELILSAYHKKKKYVRLHDSFISFDDEGSKSFKEIVDEFDISALQTQRLPIYDALKLSSYSQNELSVLYSKEIKELFDDIKNFQSEKIELEPFIEEELRPYQLDGVKWLHVLCRHGLSGILADDMGLGKTLEMIALISLSTTKKPILVVSPKSLIYNWEHEFKKWNPRQRVFVVDGDKTNRSVFLSQMEEDIKDVYITSYDSLRNDLDLYTKYSFSFLILDEGQNIANVYAKKTRAVKEVEAEHKFVLTGTPIQNSLMDLWSIFDFLMPGYLPSYQTYYHDYAKLTFEDEEQKEILMKKVMPFVLKRTKKDVLTDLPPKTEEVMYVGMSDKQRELYNAYIQRARDVLHEGNKIEILAEITRLREICVDPSMFIENFNDVSEKFNALMHTVTSAIGNGHKVLIFSTFAKTLMHFGELLKQNNYDYYMIYGDTNAKDRLSMADDFNTKDDVKIMLVSLKAGGTGLNLVGADIVIHMDPWWNLAAENQASDRAHRIGQTRAVTVMKMVCKDSIEERVIELQEMKKELASVITEGEEGIQSIDTKDLQFLLA